MYLDGRGVPQSDEEGAKWYRLAAEQGFTQAQLDLALAYLAGRGVPVDKVQAYMWFSLAAANVAPGNERDELIRVRDQVLANKMTPAEIAKAKKMVSDWKPKAAGATQASPTPAPTQAQPCKTIILDQSHKTAVLEGEIPVWGITNGGPASVVIQTKTDPAFLYQIAPSPGTATVFSGDARYTYTIGLVAPGKKATLQVCQ
jgi:hypothetical protein